MEFVDVPVDCHRCLRHYFDTPFLVEACASVAIEYDEKTTQTLLGEYLEGYHNNGHERFDS